VSSNPTTSRATPRAYWTLAHGQRHEADFGRDPDAGPRRVLVFAEGGMLFAVDLAGAERFQVRDRRRDDNGWVYRLDGNLWVWEVITFGSVVDYYEAVSPCAAVEMILTGGSIPPADLTPEWTYPLPPDVLPPDQWFDPDDARGARPALVCLRSGIWVLLDERGFGGTGRMLSDEEALDLLHRHGYPKPGHDLPPALWDLAFARRRHLDGPKDTPTPEFMLAVPDLAQKPLPPASPDGAEPGPDEADRAALDALDRVIARDGPLSTRPPAIPGTTDWPQFLSASDLANRLGVSTNAVDAFLRRYRKQYPDSAIETEGRRRCEARYLYRVTDVLPHLRAHFDLTIADDETRPS
jgi:hypothetical protein